MSELISEGWPKARISHRCYLCSRVIKMGEIYLRQFLRDGGDVWTFKGCLHCESAINSLQLLNPTFRSWTRDDVEPDCFYELDPRDAFEQAIIHGFVSQWQGPTGKMLPVPNIKEAQAHDLARKLRSVDHR